MEGVDTEVFVTTGIPHRALTEKIKEDEVDLVVIATHGRKGLAHALLGSVSEKIVRAASCPVLTVRPSE
jgi:nucleotide-binding universal stress UspA family protein